MNKALFLLSKKSFFSNELRIKLSNYDFSESLINEVIDKLTDYGYINDKRQLELFISDNKRFNKDGPLQIKQKLLKKHVNIDLDEIEVFFQREEQVEKCEKIAQKKLVALSKKEMSTFELKGKLYQYLLQ